MHPVAVSVEGLAEWLSTLSLAEHLEAVEKWCQEESHLDLEEVVENADTCAEALSLGEEEALRMVTTGHQAYLAIRKLADTNKFDECLPVCSGRPRVRFCSSVTGISDDDTDTSPTAHDECAGGWQFKHSGNVLSTCAVSETRIKRTDTAGNILREMEPARRELLLDTVHNSLLEAVDIHEGQTGTVYALEARGEKVAVFKPLTGEHFDRRGVDVGTGALREEAAYLVDRMAGSQAGVPVTSRAKIAVHGEITEGSLQAFVVDTIGFVEDFGMPRDVGRACSFVPKESVEALALLDMRIFNMDRHSGNLLLLRLEQPHALGPIDHGCCLPPWWMLGEAVFDAWQDWPHLQEAPADASREIARIAVERLPQVTDALRNLGLGEESVVTHQLCTTFVGVGVAELGLPIGPLAILMLRGDASSLSWLETRVLACAKRAGAHIWVEEQGGIKELRVDDANFESKVDLFLESLVTEFRVQLPLAVACSDA